MKAYNQLSKEEMKTTRAVLSELIGVTVVEVAWLIIFHDKT